MLIVLRRTQQLSICAVSRCHTVSYGVIRCHTVSYGVIRCHTVSYGVIRCHTVSYGVIRCHTVSYGVIRCHTVLQLVLQRILSSGPLTPTLNHTWQWYQESSHPGQFSEAHSVSIAVSSWHMSTSQKNVLRHGSTRLNGFGVTLSENPWGDTPPAGNAGSGPPGSVPDSSCFGSM